ncbi:MAG TPA: hypothetical protein VHV78_00545, partial [Gemmatimonadaceae bacterium]|nr:hypothetical protein [Gemmatimonadaceae bacterium]
NQYDFWPPFRVEAHNGDNLLLVLDDSDDLHAEFRALVPYFADVQRGALVTLRRGRETVGTRRLWLFTNWNGGWP